MILSALNDYYHRMVSDPDASMPKPGFMASRITHMVLLSRDGEFSRIIPLGEVTKKGVEGRKMFVPWTINGACRTSGKVAFPLWDKPKYSLGADGKKIYAEHFSKFQEHVFQLCHEIEDDGLKALSLFLRKWEPGRAIEWEFWEDVTSGNIVFCLESDQIPIHERPAFQEYWREHWTEWCRLPDQVTGQCLTTGHSVRLSKLHQPIKGVYGAQSSGASIVSFNLDAFESYGKKQSLNAPVAENVAFSYTTALNYLLRRENNRCLSIGDTSTVFWAEKKSPEEDLLASLFDLPNAPEEEGEPGEDARTAGQVRSLLQALRDGKPIQQVLGELAPEVRFYVLGLAPNQSRLSVRFWCQASFGELAQKVSQHYSHLSMERQYTNQPEFPALWQILIETAAQQKRENIPPMLSGALSRSVLTGSRYPESLYTAVLGRIRADKQVNYIRTAIIKACLTRNHPEKAGEITMSLNPDRKDVPYLLGRLFSLLEKTQGDALGKIGTTIRHRYFSSASASPSIVFPQLLKLSQHHIAKAEYGSAMDRKIQDVLDDVHDFPSRLSLQEQGVFTIGYYHQNNANYRKIDKE